MKIVKVEDLRCDAGWRPQPSSSLIYAGAKYIGIA